MNDERSCPSARLIIAAWGGDARARRFVEKHVQSCAHCSAIVDALEKLDAAFAHGSDIQNEIERALDQRLASESPDRWGWLATSDAKFHHRVVIAYLIRRADDCYPSDPVNGLGYAEAAIAAFEAMTAPLPPAKGDDALLYGTALKNKATHLYLLGRYSKALCSTDASARVVEPFAAFRGVKAHQGAVALARATIYGDIDVCEYEKAASAAREAETLFATAQPQRVVDARWLQAMIQARSGRLAEARQSFVKLLEATEPESPQHGSLLQCLAWCALLANDDDDALAFAASALEIHTLHQNRVERAQSEWTIGRVLSRRGEHERARAILDSSSSVFSESGQLDSWVRVRLDYIHDLLCEDAHADIRALCQRLAATSVSLDQGEPLRRRHFTAETLELLRYAASNNTVTSDEIAQVISHLDRRN
jgi:tetratricopeptide (TPR) repeat protein